MAEQIKVNKDILKHFPKIELHRHLEGTYPLDKLYELAIKNKVTNAADFDSFCEENRFPKDAEPNFVLFLSKFKKDWYRSLDDVDYISYHSVKTLVSDGIFYIELRFNPEHYAAFNNFSRVEVTKTVIAAANRAAKEDNIRVKYLITFNRGMQSESELINLYQDIKGVSKDICGYDLAGDETKYPPQEFQRLFDAIKNDGQKVTIHAGEVSPPQQIWDAITFLTAARIGHGTTTIQDEKLQKYLKKHHIILEQCLTSNRQTGSWKDPSTHPFGALLKAGVPVTLNSDDPHIQNSDLTDDYLLAIEYFHLSLQDLVKINLIAIHGAFLTPEEKKVLEKDYLQSVEDFKKKYL